LEEVDVSARPSANSAVETRAEGKTDAQGRFRLRQLLPGYYDLSFHRTRFVSKYLEIWQLTVSPAPLSIQLQPSPTIQGRVVEAAGSPVSNAWLTLFRLEPPRRPVSDPEEEEEPPEPARHRAETVSYQYRDAQRTEAGGTFVLDTPEPRAWLLRAEAEGFTPVERELTSPAKDVWLVMGVGPSVEVTVVDEQDRPVPHARVGLFQSGSREAFAVDVTTDEAGSGVLRGVEPGQYGLVAISSSKEAFRLAAASVDVRGEKPQRVRLKFLKGVSLSGQVVNRTGNPIPGVEVWTTPVPKPVLPLDASMGLLVSALPDMNLENEDSWRRLLLRLQQRHTLSAARVRTGPDGRFTVPHLLPVLHRLTFSKQGYVLARPLDAKQGVERLRWLVVPPGQQEQRVLMIDNGRVSGRVVRAGDGEPVLDFKIDSIPITSTDGRFTMSAGAPGPHSLELVAPGVGGLRREYTAQEGEDVDLGDLVVGEGRPVRVRVEDAATLLPLAEVRLELGKDTQHGVPSREELEHRSDPELIEAAVELDEPDPQPEASSLTPIEVGLASRPETEQDGTCLLPDVPARPLILIAERGGYEPTARLLGPGEQEVTFRLRPWATVQGWVRVGGAPIAKGKVYFDSLDGRGLEHLEVRNGWYSGHSLRPGLYRVSAECDGCPEPSPVFTVKTLEVPGPQSTFQVDLQPPSP
jgi:hypothetical protein